MIGVYMVRNKINDKAYVGCSVDIDSRLRGHKSMLNRNKHYNKYLQEDFNKYGIDNFEFVAIESGIKPDEMEAKEEHYTNFYKAHIDENGYCIRKNVSSNKGITLPEVSRNRISISKTGEKNPFFNKHHSKKSREKMSKSHKGEKGFWYGKKIPREFVEKSVAGRKGKMCGENNHFAKINFEIADRIREEVKRGIPVKEIALKHNISTSLVYAIRLNQVWVRKDVINF